MIAMQKHFSDISFDYDKLRTTDREPILFIKEQLINIPRIVAADIGCGTGRYSLELLKYFGDRLFLYCVDINEAMLKQAYKNLREKSKYFNLVNSSANQLSFNDSFLDAIFTFNAIHHFDLAIFLDQSARVLKKGGYLFIYTRTREQNSRNIWGNFFPLFNEKEKRLYEIKDLEKEIKKNNNWQIKCIKKFVYKRCSDLDSLIYKVNNNHYSTFSLYSKKELVQSLYQFEDKLSQSFKNLEQIRWNDENVLIVIKN